MAKQTESVTVITSPFILSYPKLAKPEPYMENGKPKGDPQYGFEGISALDSLKDWRIGDRETGEFDTGSIEAALVSLAKKLWGADFNVKAAHDSGILSWPFKSGDKKAEEKGEKADHYKGKKFWRAKALAEINGNPNSPNLYEAASDGSLTKIVRGTPSGEQTLGQRFYGGALCTAELNAVAGETAQGKYVTFYVNAVVFEKDGDRLGSGSSIERLRGVRGGQTGYDPTAGMDGGDTLDDEIPF